MAKKSLIAKIVIVSGVSIIAGLLFWMALYMLGPPILLVNVVVLPFAMAWFTRHCTDGWVLVERMLVAAIVAGQAGLVAAILIRVAPVVAKHAL